MAGGAAVAALLGPRLVRDESTGRINDSPPWPVLAHQGGAGAALGARGAKADGSGSDKGRGKKGRGKKLPKRPDGEVGEEGRP